MSSNLTHAWRNTTLFGRGRNPLSGVGSAIATFLALSGWGSETASEDFLIAAAAGVGGGVLLPGLCGFLWNLAAAPARRAREEAATERAERLRVQAQLDAREDDNAEAKRVLRERLRNGGDVRQSILNAIRGGQPVGAYVPMIDQWIATAEVELRAVAPEWVAHFMADTGDMPQQFFPTSTTVWLEAQHKINEAHLARFDRHLERLREIVYQRL